MRIEQELKLGFKDVLFRPKRSTLKSRSQVNLTREFTFKHSGRQWSGVPVIAANMDSVGSFKMAEALAKHNVMTAIHKHYSVEQWAEFVQNAEAQTLRNVMVSTGTSDNDFQKTKDIMAMSEELIFICIDIANGYSEHLVDYVQKVREAFPSKVIVAGNVVTGDMVRTDPCWCGYRKSRDWSGFCMYNSRENWCWLSSTVCNH